MATKKIRVNVSKALKIGSNTVDVMVGNLQKLFVVHKDLVMESSVYFKKLLTGVPKPVEGQCPICHDPFRPYLDRITYCKAKCGNNVHTVCADQWAASRVAAGERPCCPMCRATWLEPDKDQGLWFQNTAPATFELYLQFLYTGLIPCDGLKPGPKVGDEHAALTNAYVFGHFIEDNKFQNAVVEAIIEGAEKEGKGCPGPLAIKAAYDKTDGPCALRRLFVDLYVFNGGPETVEDQFDNLPKPFLEDLIVGLFKARRAKPSIKSLKSKAYCD